jgi:16S rRNA processing protein RimM
VAQLDGQTDRDDAWVALAEVARPHGLNGELRLKLYNADSDLLTRRPPARLVMPGGEARAITLRAVRAVPNALLVRIEGVADRDAAEGLRGARLEVARSELEPTDDDEYYHVDLEGCRVELAGEPIGRVERVASYPTCDALVVVTAQGKLEVPLQGAYVTRIDIEAGVIELSTLDGLA